jgi:CheY-like chemotaxis protein
VGSRLSRRLLIVETDTAYRDLLQRVADAHAVVEATGDFTTAYTRLFPQPPDYVIANLSIPDSGGLRLAYELAQHASTTRTILYDEQASPAVARELQRVGAFYETRARLRFALPAYLNAQLPILDRRDPMNVDRRVNYRGGRRASDVPLISAWGKWA